MTGTRVPGASVFLAASAGVLIAAAVAAWLFPIAPPVSVSFTQLLPSQLPQVSPEPREKALLALAAILGTLGAMIGARLTSRRLPWIWMLSSGVALVCAMNEILAYALTEEMAAASLTVVVIAFLAIALLILRRPREFNAVDVEARPGSAAPWAWTSRRDAAPVLVLLVLLIPSSFEAIAAKVGYEMHVVSFVIGPALYSFGKDLVPGIDYYTQYSVGLPYLFSWILPANAAATMIRYAMLMVASMFLYYLAAYYGIACLLRSRVWALMIVLAALLLNFHTERPFFDPSSYVLRHPLLVVMIPLLAWWVAGNLSIVRGLALAFVLAASLFLNTETGLLQLAAAVMVAFFAARNLRTGGLAALGIASAAILFFLALCALAFGPRVLSAAFLRQLFEPFFIYGGGYGGWAVSWSRDWAIFYNVIAPGLALGTLGWALMQLWRGAADRARMAALAAIAAMSIMLSMKYWNMSIVGLWHVNALGFLVITGWWCRENLQKLHEDARRPRWLPARQLGGVALGLGAASMVVYAGDPRNPTLYGYQAYLAYPGALARVLRVENAACKRMQCAGTPPAAEDIKLIQKYVRPGSRAAIVDWNDWLYLVEARRAPKFSFVPSAATFTRRQLEQSLSDLEHVFVVFAAKDDMLISNVELKERLEPLLRDEFVPVQRGSRYVVFARKAKTQQ